jgi:hypothetical protein
MFSGHRASDQIRAREPRKVYAAETISVAASTLLRKRFSSAD